MNQIFVLFRPIKPLIKLYPDYYSGAYWEKPKLENEAKAEPVSRALDKAPAQVDTLRDSSKNVHIYDILFSNNPNNNGLQIQRVRIDVEE